jgi:predicted membrane-bound spermidine synthase
MKKLRILIKNKGLLLVVFITGACVLVLEVVATRILSPYFGNTIFNYSSVIGTVLAALSLGYYFGGKYADKYPTPDRFYQVIIISGFSTLLIKILMIFALPTLGYAFSITSGPVVTSVILFTLPCFFMGMLSPYAIKLQEIRFKKMGIGNLSGEVFFASTLGSIFGSFLAGFYLIPTFGIGNIVLGVGVVLFLLGFCGVYLTPESKNKVFWVIFSFALLVSLASIPEPHSSSLVYTKDGYYERVSVLNMDFRGVPAVILLQDSSYSSGIRREDPNALLFDYTKYIDLYRLVNPDPRSSLFIGGGAYSMPSYLVRTLPNIQVDVVEIEPELYSLARKYFGVSDNTRLHNYTDDGRRFLFDSKKSYDIIFSDVYAAAFSIPPHFTTKEFFLTGRSKLTPDGIFLVNIIGNLQKTKQSLIYSEMRTFSEVFDNAYFFAMDSPKGDKPQNIIFLGLNINKKLNFEEIAKLHPENELFRNLSKKLVDLTNINLSDYPLMTDDYSPTEYLTSKLFI